MEKQVTRTSEMNWKPLIEEGVKTDGIYVKNLCFDPAKETGLQHFY